MTARHRRGHSRRQSRRRFGRGPVLPANDPYVITVGGVDENGSADPSGETIASWSSQGTTQDGLPKPDVYAPGAHIVSVLAPNSEFATSCPMCIVGNGQYIQTSGTSMAASMISGLVADLLQIHPNWMPDQVKGALTSSAVTENSSFQGANAVKAALLWHPRLADQGLTPSTLVTATTGTIDYNLPRWSRARARSVPASRSRAGAALTARPDRHRAPARACRVGVSARGRRSSRWAEEWGPPTHGADGAEKAGRG